MRQDGKKEEELFIKIRTGFMKAKAEEEARKNEEEQKEARRLRRKRNIAEYEEREKKRKKEEDEKRTKDHENSCLKGRKITEEQDKDWAMWKVELKMETLEAYRSACFELKKAFEGQYETRKEIEKKRREDMRKEVVYVEIFNKIGPTEKL